MKLQEGQSFYALRNGKRRQGGTIVRIEGIIAYASNGLRFSSTTSEYTGLLQEYPPRPLAKTQYFVEI